MSPRLISTDLIFSIFEKFGYCSTELEDIGRAIVMKPDDALLYSIITGHGYLDKTESNYQYNILRDQFRIFNQIDGYNFQNGLFIQRGTIESFNTLINKFHQKNYLSQNNKYVLPVKIKHSGQLAPKCSNLISLLEEKNLKCEDIIICPLISQGNNITNFESFVEYLICKYFGNLGYLTDTQIPFLYGIGTPDAMAFKNHKLLCLLNEYGFLKNGGNMIELMFPSLFGFAKGEVIKENIDNEFIAFEVKTSTINAESQLKKYTNTGYFDSVVEARPLMNYDKTKSFFTFDRDGNIIVNLLKNRKIDKKQSHYLKWLTNYIKYYIIANLDNNRYNLFIKEILGGVENKNDFIEKINNIDLENLIKIIISYM